MLIELQPTYFLHTRAYRDSSLLVEAFTRLHGRITLVARGVKNKKNRHAALLQPFAPLLASWWARGELGTLRHVELHQQPVWLTGKRLLTGLYVNELLNHLLDKHNPYYELFDHYAALIQNIALAEEKELNINLRLFEKFLITELGYGLVFNQDAKTGSAVNAENYYVFDPAKGCYQAQNFNPTGRLFKGSSLLALHHEQFDNVEQLQDAKRLMRSVLSIHLNGKTLHSRLLWN